MDATARGAMVRVEVTSRAVRWGARKAAGSLLRHALLRSGLARAAGGRLAGAAKCCRAKGGNPGGIVVELIVDAAAEIPVLLAGTNDLPGVVRRAAVRLAGAAAGAAATLPVACALAGAPAVIQIVAVTAAGAMAAYVVERLLTAAFELAPNERPRRRTPASSAARAWAVAA